MTAIHAREQWKFIPPPERFVRILGEYVEYIRIKQPLISMRELGRMITIRLGRAGDGHGMLTSILKVKKRANGEPYYMQPKMDTVRLVVEVINSLLVPDERWPITHALLAAGYDESIQRARSVHHRTGTPKPKVPPAPEHDDPMAVAAQMQLPVYDLQLLAGGGWHGALEQAHAITISSDMVVLHGTLEGLPYTAETYVLAYTGDGIPIEARWAIVRTATGMRAIPKEVVRADPTCQIVCWVIGTLSVAQPMPRLRAVGEEARPTY